MNHSRLLFHIDLDRTHLVLRLDFYCVRTKTSNAIEENRKALVCVRFAHRQTDMHIQNRGDS